MSRITQILLRVSPLLLVLLLAAVNTLACSCETYAQPRKDAREYYTKKFKGAIFTGTVLSIEHDPASDDGGVTFSKLKIRVNQYWLGVRSPTIEIEVGGPNTSCWFDWKVGEESLFIAANWKGTFLYAYCDLANWKRSDSTASMTQYTTALLGKPRSFSKPK